MIAVLVPTYGRPDNVERVLADLYATVDEGDARCYFVIEPEDSETVMAVTEAGAFAMFNTRAKSYAGAINTGLLATTEPYLLIAADDLHFHDGWLEPLLLAAQHHGLVGTNDLHNPDVLSGIHATHYLVRRDYAVTGCVDAPGVLLHEGYVHNYVDTEAVAYATARGEFVPCLDSLVEHVHWVWGLAEIDATYQKGADSESADGRRYAERRSLWT